jgi:hypothetical protein
MNNGQATPESPAPEDSAVERTGAEDSAAKATGTEAAEAEAPATEAQEETWQFGQTSQQQYEQAPPTYEAAPQYDQTPQQPTYEAAPQYGQAPPQQPSYQAAPQYGQYQQQQPTPTTAIVSLVLGIVSIVFAWTSLVGIIGGIVAIVLAKQSNEKYKTGVATGGFVTGIIGLVIGAFILFLIILSISIGAALYPGFDSFDYGLDY